MPKSHVKDCMTKKTVCVSPDETLQEAARKMHENDCGILPVGGDADSARGMITDRDIVIRAVREGKDPSTCKVSECMTPDVVSCNVDDSLEHAADIMHKNKVSRLLVKDENGTVCGIISFGNMMREENDRSELTDVVCNAQGKKAA